MNEAASIHVQALHKNYGSVHAIRGVDQTIAGGQIFGLLGPNGAGKTTLIRLLIGATKPSAGQISVLGLDPIQQKRALRNQIGYMPQSPALYEDLSAHDNIHFFCRAHQVENIAAHIEEVIEFVGLSERASDQVYKFSGGMKQRVSLACALVHKPQLLFLDEPTSGIDPQLREAFWQHFHQLTEQGVTILVSTHQMDEATNCDRLAILHQGVILAEDSPKQLLAQNKAKVSIWRQGERSEHHVMDYQRQLPGLLQSHGLDASIDRIEIEEDTLESVVLTMINVHQAQQQKEAADAYHN